MAASPDRQTQNVLDKLHSDEARRTLLALLDGTLDEDLAVLEANLKRRQSFKVRSQFRKGSRVRVSGTRKPELDGQEGEVVKVNPKRLIVFLDSDWAEFMGPREKLSLQDKVTYSRYSFPAAMLEEVS